MEQPITENRLLERPVIPKGAHPLVLDRYLLPTNEIINMYLEVGDWIENRTPGGIIYGRQRLGKSFAIDYLSRTLPLKYGHDLPVFKIPGRHKKNANEEVFYEMLLEGVGHAFPHSGKKNQKFDRLTRFLLERGGSSNYKMVVLFIDEAQSLFELNYGWLIDVYNKLEQYQIKFTCVLVGQPELKHQKSLYIAEGKRQVVGRFMVHEYEFTGVVSVSDIATCLKGYDTIYHPEDSGWSYTEYYFPIAYAKGKRLENCAQDLYETFVTMRREKKISGKLEIPMQYLTSAIKYALTKYGLDGEKKEWIDKELWRECVKKSRYIESEISFIEPTK